MKLAQLFEKIEIKRLVVVYGGRFQPFHRGHFESYKWLCKKFGDENVWIATSDKTNFDPKKGDVSPFDFKEKKEIMVSLYGINPRRIIKCKNPAFRPQEVFDLYKGFPIIYVSAVGKKDEERYRTGTFFKPFPRPFQLKDTETLSTLEDDVGYYLDVPMVVKDLSATLVRDELKNAQGDERERLFRRFFGKYDSMIDELITAKLKEVKKNDQSMKESGMKVNEVLYPQNNAEQLDEGIKETLAALLLGVMVSMSAHGQNLSNPQAAEIKAAVQKRLKSQKMATANLKALQKASDEILADDAFQDLVKKKAGDKDPNVKRAVASGSTLKNFSKKFGLVINGSLD